MTDDYDLDDDFQNEDFEEAPVILWTGDTPEGKPGMLVNLLYFFWKIDWHQHNTLVHPDTAYLVTENSRVFSPPPSEGVIHGLMHAWLHLSKITVANQSYEELCEGNHTEGAKERFIPLAPALRWFWMGLENDARAIEARKWLTAIGWENIVKDAAARDKATRAILAGQAEGNASLIEELPEYTRAKEEAGSRFEIDMLAWQRGGAVGPMPCLKDYMSVVHHAAA